MPLKQPRIGSGVNAPFKSPLRPKICNQETTVLQTPTNPPKQVTESPLSRACKSSVTEALDLNPHSEFASPHCVRNEDAPVDEFELDRSIHALKAKICAIRGLESFDDSDVEAELKKWRELLHEYNEAKDSCLYVFGQLSHLKLTTVRELYNEHNLDIDA